MDFKFAGTCLQTSSAAFSSLGLDSPRSPFPYSLRSSLISEES